MSSATKLRKGIRACSSIVLPPEERERMEELEALRRRAGVNVSPLKY